MRLDYLVRALGADATLAVRQADKRLAQTAAKLDALSPLKVLSRGYAMALREGKPLTAAAQTRPDDLLQMQFADGTVDCMVTAVHGTQSGEVAATKTEE